MSAVLDDLPPFGVALPPGFDWKAPDYLPVYPQRLRALQHLDAHPECWPGLRAFYAEHPAHFINDWLCTTDPRNALMVPPRPATVPFLLMPRQIECVQFFLECERERRSGAVVKSRDCGISNLAMAYAIARCIFRRDVNILVGSATEDKIDRSGDPDTLFFKLRSMLENLPPIFRPRFHSAHMRVIFPDTNSSVVGNAGDNIGRGGRSSLAFIDESAHVSRPELVDAALASNTDSRIDISSVAGMNNSFARRVHSGRVKVFRFHWRDDARKGDDWYEKQKRELDPVTLAQEVDIDFRADVEGTVIPTEWIATAVGAHLELGIEPTGMRRGGLDIADSGIDSCAFAGRHGILLTTLDRWSGANSDIHASVVKAFALCDEYGLEAFDFDGDGLGAGCRGSARILNDQRRASGRKAIFDTPFRGSAGPYKPDSEMVAERKNKDFFANMKAMSWWALRLRFQETFRALQGLPYKPDNIISISPEVKHLSDLMVELSQPTYSLNNAGKVVIDKKPDGSASPDLADATMIAFNPAAGLLGAELWARLGA